MEDLAPKKQIRKVASINKQVLDYYYKFGQNRDLDRYLRLRRSYNKSSSEGSINNIATECPQIPSSESKSLDQLSFVKQFCSSSSSDDCCKSRLNCHPPEPTNNVEQCSPKKPLVHVKTKGVIDKPKKAYTFNCESNINISLPFPEAATSMPELIQKTAATVTEFSQTDFDEEDKLESSVNEEPSGQQKSPEANAKSSKRLEWDSLADVGYDKGSNLSKRQSRSMSTLERSVLRGFFADQGIEINFAIENKSELPQIAEESPTKIPSKTVKEKWRETLETVKKKYSAQSTAESTGKKDLSMFSKLPDELQSTPITQHIEKYCQTSFIKRQTKEIQVNFSNSSSVKSSAQVDDVTTPSSFEYVQYKASTDGTSDKENLSPSRKSSDSKKLRQSAKKILESRDSSSQDNNRTATSELELGVKLLCSLIEAKCLNDKQKKSLAKKIVAKITKTNLAQSSSTSSSSAISGLSIINGAKQRPAAETGSELPSSVENSSTMGSTQSRHPIDEVSAPVTARRVSKEISKGAVNLQQQIDVATRRSSTQQSRTSSSSKGSQIMTVIDLQKDDEQPTMNEWLEPLTRSERAFSQDKGKGVKQIKSDVPKRSSNLMEFAEEERKSHLKWIENEIERLANLKHLLISSEKEFDSGTASSVERKTPLDNIPKGKNFYDKVSGDSRPSSAKTKLSSRSGDNAPVTTAEKQKQVEYDQVPETERPVLDADQDRPEQLPVKDYPSAKISETDKQERSKLETPRSVEDGSIRSYAKQRKEEFLKIYKKAQSQQKYDPAAVSDHYSEPREVGIKKKFTQNDAYTSVSSSDFFVSSDSISIPITASSSTTTTTHQYDSRVGIGVQTSDSMLRTKPIYGPKDGTDPQPTVRVYQVGINKQTQSEPKSVAYVINFETNTSCDTQGSTESLTLQERLERNNPCFKQRAKQRQYVIKKLHKLRNERDEQIRNILDNNSITSIPNKLRQLPPPPTKYTRIFPTKEMKAITKKKYSKLPEVIDKIEREKKEKRKKSNKMLAEIFNKRLQRRVHKGKLSLEHSSTVI